MRKYYVVEMWRTSCPSERSVEGIYPIGDFKSEDDLMAYLEKEYGAPNYEPDTFEFEVGYK